MPKSTKTHLTKADRIVIEDGLRFGGSARSIALLLDVSPSTITREVKANRKISEPKRRRKANLAVRCIYYSTCNKVGRACKNCSTQIMRCAHCKTRSCIDTCPDFELKMCPKTLKWPYICPPHCPKRSHCNFPKCSYDAILADEASQTRLISSRQGIDLTQAELEEMKELIVPLIKQGQSFEAIWLTHGNELPCGLRSAYNYQEKGLFDIADLHLPRKVRIKKRKRKTEYARSRIDRTGRTYDDFLRLPLTEQVRVVQCDSVEGYDYNEYDILSLHIVSCSFQFYFHKLHAEAAATVAWFDTLEHLLGSREAFEAIFGILLCDRGIEFDDYSLIERSCLEPNKSRCRVFYCDAMNSNQKSQAERNHEQLRRILPKNRSDFDKLSAYDLAVCCSHVNSYPSAKRFGKCPFDLLGTLLPKEFLDELGLEKVAPDDVVLKPYLMKHAVKL